jgi:hypothetical protein
MRLRSEIPFRDVEERRKVEALSHATVLATSKTYGWKVGENRGWAVDDLTIGGHSLAIN